MASFEHERNLVQSYAKEYAFKARISSNDRGARLATFNAFNKLNATQQQQIIKLLEKNNADYVQNASVREALRDIYGTYNTNMSYDDANALDALSLSNKDAAAAVSAYSVALDQQYNDVAIMERLTTSI